MRDAITIEPMTRPHTRSGLVSAGAAALVGAAAFERAFGFGVLDPTRLDWILRAGIDPSVNFLGWHMFRHEPWTHPLGAIETLGYPVGTSIALTDSVPILALVLKPFSDVLSTDFQYTGLWLLCSFVLQGVFASLLIGTATSRLALRVFGAMVFVSAPILIQRITHPTLTAHWMILAALWLYFARGRNPSWSMRCVWAMLVILAVATHPYLAAMVFSVAAAALARPVLSEGRRAAPPAVLSVAALGALAWLVAWQSGYFVIENPADLQGSGLGFFSMNLLAPLMPLRWSTFFAPGPFALATEGQTEGYAYLGAGTLFLAALLIVVWHRHHVQTRQQFFEHLPLVVVCVGLTVLALSPTVTAGSRTLFAYDAERWGPLTLFRASGRLFWPVYYALTFGIIASLVTRVSYRVALPILAGAALLQAADVSGAYAESRKGRAFSLQDPLISEFWDAALPHYRHLVLRPTNMCSSQSIDWRPFAIRAGRARMTINAGFAARYDAEKVAGYCEALARDFVSGRVADEELYVLFPRLASALASAAQKPLACTLIDGYAVCFTTASYSRWQDTVDVVRHTLPPPAEFLEFRKVLEAEYRDRMRRPVARASGSPAARLSAVTSYLAYRTRGCGHQEAASKFLLDLKGEKPLRLCMSHRLESGPLPPRNETLAFLQQVDAELPTDAVSATHVDAEGEVAWAQDYAQERLAGRTHAEATEIVLARIRAIAP
jgi:hypothetical protein